jgi:hypothetical protein
MGLFCIDTEKTVDSAVAAAIANLKLWQSHRSADKPDDLLHLLQFARMDVEAAVERARPRPEPDQTPPPPRFTWRHDHAPAPTNGSASQVNYERIGSNVLRGEHPPLMSGWQALVLGLALRLAPGLRGLLDWRAAYARDLSAYGNDRAKQTIGTWRLRTPAHAPTAGPADLD